MSSIFSPAVLLMNRLKYPAKFTLLGLFVVLAIALLLGSLASNLFETIALSRKELAALELLRPMAKQVQLTQQHRGLSAGVLGGNQAMKDKLTAKQAEVDAAVATVAATVTRLAPQLPVGQEWAGIKQDWDKLRSNGMNLSVPESLAAHGALIERILSFQTQIADIGALNGDPDIDTFYMIDTAVNRLPEMLERLGKVRAKGTGTLSKKELSQQDRTDFSVHVVILQRALGKLSSDLGKVAKATPFLEGKLTAFSRDLSAASNDVIKMVNDDILTETYSIPSQDYFDKATTAINIGYSQLFDTLFPSLEGQLNSRIEKIQRQLALEIGLSVVACLLLAYLFVGVYLSIVAAVRKLADGSRAMAGGDLTVRISLESHDELSLVADSFNQMVDSFNNLLRKVQQTASSVSAAAIDLAGSSAKVSDSSQKQSAAAIGMATAVEEMTASISQITENANSAQEVSVQSGELSQESSRIVDGTVLEMQQIAQTVNQSAGIIEELGHNTAKISAIVGVIKEIADQTNLLALNAAIEAARAGEQGRGFAVVADEVRKLAERTSHSTQEIGSMIHSIQSGTENAVGSMKGGVESVAQGVAMSQEAGVAIGKVKEGADHVLKAISDISVALREQSSVSNNIASSVEHIAQMAEANSAAVSSVASTAQQLEYLSNELTDEVRRFRVN